MKIILSDIYDLLCANANTNIIYSIDDYNKVLIGKFPYFRNNIDCIKFAIDFGKFIKNKNGWTKEEIYNTASFVGDNLTDSAIIICLSQLRLEQLELLANSHKAKNFFDTLKRIENNKFLKFQDTPNLILGLYRVMI